MHRPGDLRLAACSFNHFVDGEPREGLAPLTGEDVGALGLLLTLQTLQAGGFVTGKSPSTIDASLIRCLR